MTLQDYLKTKTAQLLDASVDEPENEARLLVETISGRNRAELRFSLSQEMNEAFSEAEQEALEKAFQRRCAHEPLAYIAGHAPFYDLEFEVGPGVLIPRFDTEILVETAMAALGMAEPFSTVPKEIPQVKSAKPAAGEGYAPGGRKADDAPVKANAADNVPVIYDLCTGSGCIGITVAHLLTKRGVRCELYMTEISEEAAEYARKNAQRILGASGTWPEEAGETVPGAEALCDVEETATVREEISVAWRVDVADLWPKDAPAPADLILSNPPYIAQEEMAELEPEVREHEPAGALTDGTDGLTLYRRMLEGIKNHLKIGGVLAVEHGYEQKEPVELIFETELKDVKCIRDLGGNDRVTLGRRGQ